MARTKRQGGTRKPTQPITTKEVQNMEESATDVKGEANGMKQQIVNCYPCIHYASRSTELEQILELIKSPSREDIKCQQCGEKVHIDLDRSPRKREQAVSAPTFLWRCLDCTEFFCGDEINFCPTGHMLDHALVENHPLCTRSDVPTEVWCIVCEECITTKDVKASGNMSVHRVRSMENLGNTCFYNSIMQILMSMDCLRANFEKLEYHTDRPITNNLRSLFKKEIDHRGLFDSICSNIPKFQGYEEQDSQEFLLAFFNGLLQEGTSCVNDIFQGMLSTTVLCSQCGHSSRGETTFLDLSLSLPSMKMDNVLPANEEKRGQDNGSTSGSSVAKVFVAEISSSPENCCGQHPFSCNKDSGEVADLLEIPQKKIKEDLAAAEEEKDPEDCCGQHPCICNKDSGEVAGSLESQQKDQIIGQKDKSPEEEEEEEEEDEEKDEEENEKDPPDRIFRAGILSGNNNDGPLSIERCLDMLTAPELIEYGCDDCTVLKSKSDHLECPDAGPGKGYLKSETSDFQVDFRKDEVKLNAENRCLIFQAPSVLVIHLKRFKQDAHGISEKIDSHVNFQEMLDLTPYMHYSCHPDKEKFHYRLIGVVEHLGGGLETGHYVAYVRGVRSEVEGGGPAWFKANDDIVQEVQLQEVLESEAYILFFEKIQH